MKHKKKRRTIMAVAPTLLATAITLFVKGQIYKGAGLMVVVTVLFVGYELLDEQSKGEPTLPEGVDAEMLQTIAIALGNQMKETHETYEESTTNE